MRVIAALCLLLPITPSFAQSYVTPVVPVIKQALPLSELTLGAGVDTEFDDQLAAAVSAVRSPGGRFGYYVGGGPLLSDFEGGRFSLGLAYTFKEPTGQLLDPAVEIHAGAGYTRLRTKESEDSDDEEGERRTKVTRLDFPLAIGLFLSLPVKTWNLQPWLSPRIHVRHSNYEESLNATDFGVGASFGLPVAHRAGPGVYVGGDSLAIDDALRDSDFGFELVAGGFYILNLN
ncbi:MAG: hypothetical protein WBW88_04120 [Rhodothermales bacterium]